VIVLPQGFEGCGYLAAEGFEAQLEHELAALEAPVVGKYGRLYFAPGPELPVAWAQNVWKNPRRLAAPSIGAAAKALRALQRGWWPYMPVEGLARRTKLVQEELPHVSAKELEFPPAQTVPPLGAYLLIDQGTLVASPACSSAFPDGVPRFREFKEGPPSRAYLKLFEALTVLGRWPQPGERVLELGAAPGGWTWVLARLGADVTAYDRAPLAPHVDAMPGVHAVKGDAFAARPDRVAPPGAPPLAWLVSDIICYPEKLYGFVKEWIESGRVETIVVTVKFQGETQWSIVQAFAAFPGARLMHLFHNKHELTFAWRRPDEA
jgi:23S rRNA (cytidine2498-2'-O)-methyltransferase